jgi:hypothetical protein
MSLPEHELHALVGTQLPAGTTTIERWENTLFCDAVGSAPLPDGLAHPAFLFHLPLRGAGLEIAELLAFGRPESEEAVRAGGYRWTLHRPLRVDTPYRVTGSVIRAERKRGRRAGLMDALTFRFDLSDGDTPVATAETTCLFLRPER